MYQIQIRIHFNFISKNKRHMLWIMSNSHDFSLSTSDITFALDPKYEFDKDIGCVFSLIKNTKELRFRVNQYINKYKNKSPSLNRLNTFIKTLEEDESFYLLPATENVSQTQLIKIQTSLSLAHLDIANRDAYIKNFNSNFSDFIFQYSIDGVDPREVKGKKKIGEGFKANRVCRFCNNKNEQPTTFSKEAHAISESLGNKKIILNEECDFCNEYFDKNIERDIDTYLKLYSSFFRVKNKDNKVSKIKGKNFSFEYINKNFDEHDAHIDFVLAYRPTNPESCNSDSEPPKILDLHFHQKIRNQNIYKSLVKFALSVISSSKDLYEFNETIEWIKSPTKFYENLPKIAILKNYQFYHKEPSLLVYRSKNKRQDLPYAVGEFHYTFLTYIFIIPLFNSDEIEFSQQSNFDYFVKFFPQFKKLDGWNFEDFSNYEEKEFVIKTIFSQRIED
ncbi:MULTISPECIES: HNH endonuclease [Pectobacterium]|uniref:HNH endonuclease n=1 Tax=Pectobacterium TaxID=122277 RepID=UPI001886C9CF|nr:HNH endonuclease [Pectobacterium carotovorum]